MDTAVRKFKIKFVNGEVDSHIEVPTSKTVKQLLSQLKQQLGTIKHIRLIASGQELVPEVKISDVPGDTLHCIVSEFAPQHGRHATKKTRKQSCFERMEMLDPGVVLMWICGFVLFAFWTLFFYQRELFEDSNVAILTILTLGFLFPCFSFYVSGGHATHRRSDSVSSAGTGVQSIMEDVPRPTFEDYDTPPRPQAPLHRAGM